MTREEILKKYKHIRDNIEIYFDFDDISQKIKTYTGYGALWEYSISHRRLVIRIALNSDSISTDNYVDSVYIYCNDTSYLDGTTKIPNARFGVKQITTEDEKMSVWLEEHEGRLSVKCSDCYMIFNKKMSNK